MALQPYKLRPRTRAVNVLASGPETARYISQGPGTGRSVYLHSGADFPGLLGESVMSMMDGVVIGVFVHRADGVHEEVSKRSDLRASRLGTFKAPYGFGLYIIVRHSSVTVNGLPLHTGYHHLDQALVRQGDKVLAGQVIARMGKSGTNPVGGAVHLHLDTFYAVPGAPREQQWALNPLGFQRWAPKGPKKPGTSLVWPVDEFVVALAFPKSATARGVEGKDVPLSTSSYPTVTLAEGGAAALVGHGTNTPLDRIQQRTRPSSLQVFAAVTSGALAVGLGYRYLRSKTA